MATASNSTSLAGVRLSADKRTDAFPADSLRFDYLYAALTAFFAFGMFLDGWAHNHGLVDNTFLTPWHGVLYGSVLLIAIVLFGTHFLNLRKGYSIMRALPRGYTLSLVGVGLFFVAGGLDFVWHSLFGFEANLETLVSPAHLLLATSAFLFVTGPLRAIWLRGNAKGWLQLFPAIVSLTVLLSLLTFFTQFAHFIGNPWFIAGTKAPTETFFNDQSGVTSVIVGAAITIGVILFAIRRWKLPFGTLTLMMTVNFGLMIWMRYHDYAYMNLLVGGAFVTGLIGDALLLWLKPSSENPIVLRVFAFAFPALLSLMYFVVLMATAGLWWKVHMWLGTIFFTGIAGLFLSYLMVPPALPVDTNAVANK